MPSSNNILKYYTGNDQVSLSINVFWKTMVVLRILVMMLLLLPSPFTYKSYSFCVDGFILTKSPTLPAKKWIPTTVTTATIAFPSARWERHHYERPTRIRSRRHYMSRTANIISARYLSIHQRQLPQSTIVLSLSSTSSSTTDNASKDDQVQPAIPPSMTTTTGISMSDAVFGVTKAMVGSGLLALSSGLAMVTNVPSHLYMAHVLLIVMGIISAYTFILYGKLVHATQAQTLGELWKMIYGSSSTSTQSKTASPTTASMQLSDLTVSMATFIFCFGSCIAYSLTFGDMFSNFIKGMVGFCASSNPNTGTSTSFLLSNFLQSRQASILFITGSIIFPLCRLSSLAALAPTSILGVIGIIVTTGFLGYRCPSIVPTSPYRSGSVGAAGTMLANVIQQPSFSTYSRIQSPAPLIFIAMACVSYLAHFSAPDFYHSFLGPKPATSSSMDDDSITTTPIRRYNQMTVIGYTIVTLLNICALTCGFLTFGGGCDGIILNNYNNIDMGAIVSRLLVGISVIGSYPFVMSCCRNAAMELWNTLTKVKTSMSSQSTSQKERRMTNLLLGIITSISLFTKDAGFVIGFNGAVMGSTIAFTFPAMLFLKYHRKNHSNSTIPATSRTLSISKFDVWACRGLIGFGIISSIVGGITTIISSFAPHLLSSS